MESSSRSRARRRACPSISTLLLLLDAVGVLSQGTPYYVADQSCYSDTSTLFNDTFSLALDIADGASELRDAYVFVFCPGTVVDFGTDLDTNDPQEVLPILPMLHNSFYVCGPEGDVRDECVFKGGHSQVLFEDEFWTDNVTFVGLTFEESQSVSVAAHGTPYSDAFFINCIWRNHNGAMALVNIFWKEGMEHGIFEEPSGGGRRRVEELIDSEQRKRLQDMMKNTSRRAKKSMDVNLAVPLGVPSLHRRLQSDPTRPVPNMYAVFQNCFIAHNMLRLAAILNNGGVVEVIGSVFEFNKAVGVILNTENAIFGTHSGTKFVHNQDLLGPVFLDSSSELFINEDTEGESNSGLASADLPGNGCDGIFLEQPGENCLAIPESGMVPCEGDCCAFGDTTCDTYDQDVEPPAIPSEAFSTKRPSSGGGCDTTCIVIAVVVPVAAIALIGLGACWYMRRGKSSGGSEAGTFAESEQPPPENPHHIS